MDGILGMDTKPPGRDLGRLRFWFLDLLLSSVVAPASWITTPWSQLSLHSFAQLFHFLVWAPLAMVSRRSHEITHMSSSKEHRKHIVPNGSEKTVNPWMSQRCHFREGKLRQWHAKHLWYDRELSRVSFRVRHWHWESQNLVKAAHFHQLLGQWSSGVKVLVRGWAFSWATAPPLTCAEG